MLILKWTTSTHGFKSLLGTLFTIKPIASANAGNIPIEVSMFENKMTTKELLDSECTTDIEVTNVLTLPML